MPARRSSPRKRKADEEPKKDKKKKTEAEPEPKKDKPMKETDDKTAKTDDIDDASKNRKRKGAKR